MAEAEFRPTLLRTGTDDTLYQLVTTEGFPTFEVEGNPPAHRGVAGLPANRRR